MRRKILRIALALGLLLGISLPHEVKASPRPMPSQIDGSYCEKSYLYFGGPVGNGATVVCLVLHDAMGNGGPDIVVMTGPTTTVYRSPINVSFVGNLMRFAVGNLYSNTEFSSNGNTSTKINYGGSSYFYTLDNVAWNCSNPPSNVACMSPSLDDYVEWYEAQGSYFAIVDSSYH